MEPYIILDGVSKSFRSVEVLKPLSIEFEEGLIHGIVGRNGSGKTVMMKLILGFLKPTQGTVTVGKKRVGKDVDFPQDVGAIIENVDFIPYLNAYDNLYNLAAIRHRITKEDVKQVLETVGLGDTGRILVRESGTEPLIRVMVEAETKEICHTYVDEVVSIINKKEAAR